MDELQTLLRPLIEQPETAPEPVGWIAGQARRRTHRRRGLQLATATVVLAVPTWLVVQRDPGVDTTTGPAGTASTTTNEAAGTTEVPTGDSLGPDAPWAGPPLPGTAVPAYVEAAANNPDAAAKCPVVAPDDLGDGAAATPRPTTADETDRWGVAYDLPGAPGQLEDAEWPTADAGQNTFAVTAMVMPPVPAGWPDGYGIGSVRDMVTKREQTHEWSDGSVAGWGDIVEPPQPPATVVVDGEVIDLEDTFPPAHPGDDVLTMREGDDGTVAGPTGTVIQFQLPDVDPSCLYSVDSYLGADHAFHLLEHLRRVEGT